MLKNIEYKWLVAAVFVSGLFMELLDTTIVNVALPTLAQEFDAEVSQLEWVVTAYLLSLAVWIPASGWLGDRFGTKRIFILALVLFTAGSALCAAAWSIESLIAFRVVQGIGGGMMTPVGTAMLFRAFPPYERAKASSVLVVPISIAPAMGPIVGGLLIDNFSWHWIFLVNVPVGIVAIIFAALVLEEHTEKVGSFDLAGFVLSATSLPLILYALSRAPQEGWTSPEVLGLGGLGFLLLGLLIYVELHVKEPMLALRLFQDRMFRSANIMYFVMMAGLTAVIFLMPLFLQGLDGLSATQSGLTTFPQAIGIAVIARFATRAYPRLGPRLMIASGLTVIAITTFVLATIDLDTNLWFLRAVMFARGIGFGWALIPTQAATFATISRADSGNAASLFSTNRQVSASVGVAVVATVLVERTQHYLLNGSDSLSAETIQNAALDGFRDAYLVAGVFSVAAILLALRIHDEDAVASMKPTEPDGH